MLMIAPSHQAITGRCARRNERTWRTATGILSFGSLKGKRLTSDFGASITDSIAMVYGCGGESSGMTSPGVWQERTKSRDTVYTKSARLVYMLVRKSCTISIEMSGRRVVI